MIDEIDDSACGSKKVTAVWRLFELIDHLPDFAYFDSLVYYV